jgi:hypothetical protein
VASAQAPAASGAPGGRSRPQEDDILRSIAHLDALIANIHARGAARGRGSSGVATPAAGASRGGSRGGPLPSGGALMSSPYSSSSAIPSRGRAGSGGGGATDMRELLSPATRALLGMP